MLRHAEPIVDRPIGHGRIKAGGAPNELCGHAGLFGNSLRGILFLEHELAPISIRIHLAALLDVFLRF